MSQPLSLENVAKVVEDLQGQLSQAREQIASQHNENQTSEHSPPLEEKLPDQGNDPFQKITYRAPRHKRLYQRSKGADTFRSCIRN